MANNEHPDEVKYEDVEFKGACQYVSMANAEAVQLSQSDKPLWKCSKQTEQLVIYLLAASLVLDLNVQG